MWTDAKNSHWRLRVSNLKELAHRYRRFPFISSWSAFLNTAGLQLPTLLIVALYGVEPAGLFALVQRVIGNPLDTVGQSVSQLYAGKVPQLLRNNPTELRRLFTRTVIQLAIVGSIPTLVVLVFGDQLFEFAFGEQWADGGTYARILMSFLYIRFVTSPLSQTLNILERQELQLIWDVIRLLISSGGVVFSAQMGLSYETALGIYSTSMVVAYLILLSLIYYALRPARLMHSHTRT